MKYPVRGPENKYKPVFNGVDRGRCYWGRVVVIFRWLKRFMWVRSWGLCDVVVGSRWRGAELWQQGGRQARRVSELKIFRVTFSHVCSRGLPILKGRWKGVWLSLTSPPSSVVYINVLIAIYSQFLALPELVASSQCRNGLTDLDDSQDMLRHCRCWLISGTEAPSRPARALQ